MRSWAEPPAARLISRPPPGRRATFAAPSGPVPIGVRDGQEITADPAALGGVGLTGPGAPAAARAILAGLPARPPRGQDGTPAEIIIPAPDAARLLAGPPGPWAHPPIRGVSVPPALDEALDEAETMIVRHARTAGGDDGEDGPQTIAVVLAAAPGAAAARGPLADGAGYDWAEPYAETARRRALDAWARIAEILQPSDPEQALSALEAALTHDPYNEYTYQQIMRLQAAAGRADAVRRTLALLETRLSELDVTPGASTRQLAATLLGTGGPRNSGSSPQAQPRSTSPGPAGDGAPGHLR